MTTSRYQPGRAPTAPCVRFGETPRPAPRALSLSATHAPLVHTLAPSCSLPASVPVLYHELTVSLYTRAVWQPALIPGVSPCPALTLHFHFSALSHPTDPHRPTIPWLAPPIRRASPRSLTLRSLPVRPTSPINAPHLSLPTLLVHFPSSSTLSHTLTVSPRNLPLRPRVGRHAAKEQRPPAAHRVLGAGRLRAQDRPVRVQAGVLGRGVPPQRLPELVQRARDVPVD